MKSAVSVAMVAASIVAVAPLATEATSSFSDVKSTDYFYGNVLDLENRGIIQGYADGTFKPHATVTRGQAAKILAGVLKLNTTNVVNPKFKDVSEDHQYYGAIAALVQAGILNGYEDATFRPNEHLQRYHMAAILTRAFSLKESGQALPFNDVPASYKAAVGALFDSKVTTGKTATTFDGNAFVTRGQLAAFIGRAENVMNVAPDEVPVATEKQETFTVTNYSATTITTQAGSLKMSEQVRAIFADSNKAALKNATITATVKGGVVTKVTAVTINASGNFNTPITFNLGKTALQDLTINGDYVEVQNATLTNATITGNVQHAATFKNVKITGEFAVQKANVATASLVPVAAIDNGPTISFIGSDVYFGRIDRENISLDLDPESNASTFVISAAVRVIDVNGNVDVFDLSFAVDVVLTGEANIREVLVGAAANLIVELTGVIDELKVSSPDASIELTGDVVVGLLNIPLNSKVEDILKNYEAVEGAIQSIVNDLAGNTSSDGASSSEGGGSSGGGGSSDGGGSSEETIPNVPTITSQSVTERGVDVLFDAPLTEELLKTFVVKIEIKDYKAREEVLKFESFDDPRLQVSEGNRRITVMLPNLDAFHVKRNVKYSFDYNGLSRGGKEFPIEPSEKFAISATAEGINFDGEGVLAFINAYQSDNVLIQSTDDGKVDILFDKFTDVGEGYQFVLFYNEQAYVLIEDNGSYMVRRATEDDLYIGKENIERSLNVFSVHGTTAFYSPNAESHYSYRVSEDGEDIATTEYWVTAGEMEAMEAKWRQLHAVMTSEGATLFDMYNALESHFQAVDAFIAAAKPGLRVQQGLADMIAENGRVTLTFNAPLTEVDKAALTVKRKVQDNGEVEITYNANDLVINGNTVTITEPQFSAVPFERVVTYTAMFDGEFGQETKTAEVIIEALDREYLLLTSSENIEFEGEGTVLFAGTKSIADTAKVSMLASDELILTFDTLTDITTLGDFVFTFNGEEYIVNQEENTIHKATEDDRSLTRDNLERSLNVFMVHGTSASYSPLDGETHFSYYASEDGTDILTTEYWATQAELDQMSEEWTQLHEAYKGAENLTLTQMYAAQQRFFGGVEQFVEAAQKGTKIQQGLASITAEDGTVTMIFNAPLTEEELESFTLERQLTDEGSSLEIYDKDHEQIQIEGNTITFTDNFVASAMERTVKYTAKLNGAMEFIEVTLPILSGESLSLTSVSNMELEGEGTVIFVNGGTTSDSVTVVTTASQNLIMTFENLTQIADIYKMGLLIGGKEYYLTRNNSNEMEIELVEDLSAFNSAATLSSEGIEKLLNVTSSDSDYFYFNGFFDQPDNRKFHISTDGNDVPINEYWVTPAQLGILEEIASEAMRIMSEGQTMLEKYEAQQIYYKAILKILEDADAQVGLME